jgi:hypothetical protein
VKSKDFELKSKDFEVKSRLTTVVYTVISARYGGITSGVFSFLLLILIYNVLSVPVRSAEIKVHAHGRFSQKECFTVAVGSFPHKKALYVLDGVGVFFAPVKRLSSAPVIREIERF